MYFCRLLHDRSKMGFMRVKFMVDTGKFGDVLYLLPFHPFPGIPTIALGIKTNLTTLNKRFFPVNTIPDYQETLLMASL